MDTDVRHARRVALEDLTHLPAYLTALARSGQLVTVAGQQSRVIVQLALDERKLRSHPWATRRYSPSSGTWWAPATGKVHAPGSRMRTHGDPMRVYLMPATDRGVALWNDDVAIPFDDTNELVEWLAERVRAWREPKSPRQRQAAS